jgi:hypothetical protein
MAMTAAVVSGSLSATGAGLQFSPQIVKTGGALSPASMAYFNISVSGTFVATYQIYRSIDGGLTFSAISLQGVPYSFTQPMNETMTEIQNGAIYYINVSSWTSGTLNYAFGQAYQNP